MAAILINTDSTEHTWAGIVIHAGGNKVLDSSNKQDLSEDSLLLTALTSGVAVVEDDGDTLDAETGLLYLKNQVEKVEENVEIQTAIGTRSASVVEVTDAVYGIEFDINDHFYMSTRLDGLVNGEVSFNVSFVIDNNSSNKHIAFETKMKSATLGESILGIDNTQTTLSPGILLPETPYIIFEHIVKYTSVTNKLTFFGITRIDADDVGGDNPFGKSPIMIRLTKIYRKRLD